MQNYVSQIFDDLYKSLVEIDPFEVKIAEDEGVFGQQQAADLVESQIFNHLERIAYSVRYDYPIEYVTVNKTIDVIDLDGSQKSVQDESNAHLEVQPTPIDEDLVVVDEIRHDLELNSFFKLLTDSIQQVQFSGLQQVTHENCRSMF